MSLFDVIRYANVNIHDFDEMAKLPEGITYPWRDECYNIVGKGLHNPDPVYWRGRAPALSVMSLIVDYHRNHYNIPEDMLHNYFTHLLKERIKAYDDI